MLRSEKTEETRVANVARCCVLLALTACATTPAPCLERAPAVPIDKRVSLYVGVRSLDEDDYEPIEDQATFGLEFSDDRRGSRMLGWEIGFMLSGDDRSAGGADVEGTTAEVYGGLHESFGTGTVRPYLGGGVSFIASKVDIAGVGEDTDSSYALYMHGGVAFDVNSSLLLGIDFRLLFGSDMDIAGVETDADYGQAAVFLGFAF